MKTKVKIASIINDESNEDEILIENFLNKNTNEIEREIEHFLINNYMLYTYTVGITIGDTNDK